jgi:hypothetical protein
MSVLSKVILPELERQLIAAAPSVIEYLLENAASVVAHLIKHVGETIQGANHGGKVDTKGNKAPGKAAS